MICIGAGASGINLACELSNVCFLRDADPSICRYKVKTHLRDVEFVAYEKNPDIGGTWSVNSPGKKLSSLLTCVEICRYENRYPGI